MPLQFFFGIVRLFFEKNPQGSPFKLFDVLRHNGCRRTPKGPFLQFFRHFETFFEILFLKKGPTSIFSIFCDKKVDNFERVSGAPIRSIFLSFSGTVKEKT